MAVNVYLKNQLRRLRRPIPFDFAKLRVKGRGVLGNIVTKNQVERISRIMPSAADSEESAPEQEPGIPPVGTLSALLDGSTQPASDTPAAPTAAPAEAVPTAPPDPTAEETGLDESIHEQTGFEF